MSGSLALQQKDEVEGHPINVWTLMVSTGFRQIFNGWETGSPKRWVRIWAPRRQYISGIYCQLGDYMLPIPPFRGTISTTIEISPKSEFMKCCAHLIWFRLKNIKRFLGGCHKRFLWHPSSTNGLSVFSNIESMVTVRFEKLLSGSFFNVWFQSQLTKMHWIESGGSW